MGHLVVLDTVKKGMSWPRNGVARPGNVGRSMGPTGAMNIEMGWAWDSRAGPGIARLGAQRLGKAGPGKDHLMVNNHWR
jgi:hypothetical protein